VAHVGKKFALSTAGSLSLVFGDQELGVGLNQFLGAGSDGLFQAVAILQKFFVAMLNFLQHLVKGVGELSQIVVGLFYRAGSIVLACRHQTCHRRQMRDRLKNRALQAGGEGRCY